MSPREKPASSVWRCSDAGVHSGLWCCDNLEAAHAISEAAYLRDSNVGRLLNRSPIMVSGVKRGLVTDVRARGKTELIVEVTSAGCTQSITFYKDCVEAALPRHRVGASWLPLLHQAALSLW
jgi:hypothetical protein